MKRKNSTIKKILNSGFKVDFKHTWIENYYNKLINVVSGGRFTTFDEFMSIIIVNKNDLNVVQLLKNNISDFIQQYEKVSKLESRLFGEVFTPRILIDEMLDTLPIEVWRNKDLKWLDPAVGIGNFPAAILDRLMIGLSNIIVDEGERRKHILEQMLYMVDISTKNLFLLYMLFDKNNEFKLNVYRGSFLTPEFDKHMKEIWKVDGYSVICGNPPYNMGGSGTGNTIWHLFLEKASNICKNYITFIHPSSWRMPLGEGDRLYKSSQIIKNKAEYIRILKKEESNKYFGLSIKVDYYLLNMKKTDGLCEIENTDELIEKNIKLIPFIPSYNFDLFDNLRIGDKFCEVIYSSRYDPRNDYVSTTEDEKFRYKLLHTTPKRGNRYLYSSRNDLGHFGIPKVIFGDSGIYDVIIDMEGTYGMTQHSIGLKVSSIEEAKNIKTALMSDSFSSFIDSVMWGNFGIDRRLFSYIKNDFWKEFVV